MYASVNDIIFLMALIQSDHARLEANRWLVWGRLLYVSTLLMLYGAATLNYAFTVCTVSLPRRALLFFVSAYALCLLMWVLWYLMGKYHWYGCVNAFSFAQTLLDIGLITLAALMAEEPLIFFF